MTLPIDEEVQTRLQSLAGSFDAIGVAFSGGGDSMALLHLTRNWAGPRRIMAATVDHNLRPESAVEAAYAAKTATSLAIPHEILTWRDHPRGNLMTNAREARLRLLSAWAHENGLQAILLGHTLDDQAETVLMRLGRGAGVDGLSGMSPARLSHGALWLRPMLTVRRAALRDWLRARGIRWIDDPSNDNELYERVRLRKAMAGLGIAPEQIAQTAANMANARDALQHYAAQVVRDAWSDRGSLALQRTDFIESPEEIRRRILVAALRWVTGADYAPRREKIARLLSAIAEAARATLDGVIIETRDNTLHFIREPKAALHAVSDGRAWDNRWQVSGLGPEQHIGALGYGPLPDLDWRTTGLTRDEAAATPAIWQGDKLIAAPALAPHPDVTVTPLRQVGHFRALFI